MQRSELVLPPILAPASAGELAAYWRLGAGRAATLRVREPGVLRIKRGRVWATFENAQQDVRVRAGDHFLARGESLDLLPGQTVVIESLGSKPSAAALFSWDPAGAH